MQARILSRKPLFGIPSASGIEVTGGQIFVIGDDSAWLFVLNRQYELVRRIRLYEPVSGTAHRIPKPMKADLEAMAAFQYRGSPQLFVIGSGSAQNRNVGFRIETEGAFRVHAYDLSGFYGFLRRHPQIVGNRRLNLEGLAVSKDTIFFLQRGNVSGINALVSLPLPVFFDCLENNRPVAEPDIRNCQLPEIQGLLSGFSGLAAIDSHRLLFTATLENTADEIADGQSLGSFAGVIDLRQPETRLRFAPILANQPYASKVESIAVLEMISENHLHALAVTDSDGGVSELLVLEIQW